MIGESQYETPVRVQAIVEDNALGQLDVQLGIPAEAIDFEAGNEKRQAHKFLEEQEPDVDIVRVETVA